MAMDSFVSRTHERSANGCSPSCLRFRTSATSIEARVGSATMRRASSEMGCKWMQDSKRCPWIRFVFRSKKTNKSKNSNTWIRCSNSLQEKPIHNVQLRLLGRFRDGPGTDFDNVSLVACNERCSTFCLSFLPVSALEIGGGGGGGDRERLRWNRGSRSLLVSLSSCLV